MSSSPTSPKLPKGFIQRRIQSLTGIWLTIFLIQHLFINSQATFWLGEDGKGFIRSVNGIQELPFLPVIEFAFLLLPFLLHGYWGIQYIRNSAPNSIPQDGTRPFLNYPTNHRYTWQRISGLLLVIGLFGHVLHMRILKYPKQILQETTTYYAVPVAYDTGLDSLSQRLGFTIIEPNRVESKSDHRKEVLTLTPSFGMAELLMLRDTFKNPWMMGIYTCFVIVASFHAAQGIWTFMIRWGITLTQKGQIFMLRLSICLMISLSFLGCAAIWGVYWINLKH